MKRLLKFLGYTFVVTFALVLIFIAYVKWGIEPKPPVIANKDILNVKRQTLDSNFYKINNCWLRKSNSGLWEEYIEGNPFDRGVIAGKLTEELSYKQEAAFVDQIHKLVPNDNYLHMLGYLTRFFNRHLA
ncbi:MAG: peptidase, partial [Bacteroidetes bacterium]|nr:peptidase [Bacteroidota bacterium]